MSTPRSLLYAATYADPELPRVINAYRAELAEAEMRAARAVLHHLALMPAISTHSLDFDDAAIRAIIEKAKRVEAGNG